MKKIDVINKLRASVSPWFFKKIIFICLFIFLGKLYGQTNIATAYSTTFPHVSIIVYPDTTKKVFIISTGIELSKHILSVEVLDLNGSVVRAENIEGATASPIYIGDLSNGVYFLREKYGREIIGYQRVNIYFE